jgi:hypothetical protein
MAVSQEPWGAGEQFLGGEHHRGGAVKVPLAGAVAGQADGAGGAALGEAQGQQLGAQVIIGGQVQVAVPQQAQEHLRAAAIGPPR